MRVACRAPRRAFPVRQRSTASPAASHPAPPPLVHPPETFDGGSSANFISALERRYTTEQARFVPAETSSARREAMKLFAARVTNNLAINLPAARNYYELAKALRCLTPELCERTLPVALRENDRRWTVAIYSDWEALAPGQIPISAIGGAFRALAPFCLWSRLTTILESIAVRGLRLPDNTVVSAMRGASAGTHPDAHTFVLTALRLGYPAPGLIENAMMKARPTGFTEQRTAFFIQAFAEGNLPSMQALMHYCEVLARTQDWDQMFKLLTAARKHVTLDATVLMQLLEAAAHVKNYAMMEEIMEMMRNKRMPMRPRVARTVEDTSKIDSIKMVHALCGLTIYSDSASAAGPLLELCDKTGHKLYGKERTRLEILKLLHASKQAEAEALWRTFAEPRPRFPQLGNDDILQKKDKLQSYRSSRGSAKPSAKE